MKKPAVVAPVNRIMTSLGGEALHVPAHVGPGSEDTLEHVLFALKHEGTNLQDSVRRVPWSLLPVLGVAVRLGRDLFEGR